MSDKVVVDYKKGFVVVTEALSIYEKDSLFAQIPATYDLSGLPDGYRHVAAQSIMKQKRLQIKVRDTLSDEEERNLELGYIGRFGSFICEKLGGKPWRPLNE